MDVSGPNGSLTKCHLIFCAFLLLAFQAVAQSAPGSCQVQDDEPKSASADESVAAAARKCKTSKASHAKKVFSDEDMEVWSGRLPKLKMEGTENSEEIITAIATYKASHTAEQTERAVRTWYER